jgi:hypothetical protein
MGAPVDMVSNFPIWLFRQFATECKSNEGEGEEAKTFAGVVAAKNRGGIGSLAALRGQSVRELG